MKLKVQGMTCGHCVGSVTKAVERLGARASVDLARGTVEVDGTSDVAAVQAAIEGEGYTVLGLEGAGSAEDDGSHVARGGCCGGRKG